MLDAFKRALAFEVPEIHCKLIHALQQCKLLHQREALLPLQVAFEFLEYVRFSDQGLVNVL